MRIVLLLISVALIGLLLNQVLRNLSQSTHSIANNGAPASQNGQPNKNPNGSLNPQNLQSIAQEIQKTQETTIQRIDGATQETTETSKGN